MTHHLLAAHGSFADVVRLGKLEPKHDDRTLRLGRYLDDAALPALPDEFDLTPPVTEWPMYGNDRKGDCTIAATGHMIEAWTAAKGQLVIPADADIEAAYIPGTGTDDTGRFELDVLNFWRQTGIGGDKIGAFAAVDPKNHDHVRAGAFLFGGLYIGVALPNTAKTQPVWDLVGDGKTGDSQPGSWGGHAVDVVAYTPQALTVVTWGNLLRMTWPFWDAYVDEAYVIISPDMLADGVSPQGLDLAALTSDMQTITA